MQFLQLSLKTEHNYRRLSKKQCDFTSGILMILKYLRATSPTTKGDNSLEIDLNRHLSYAHHSPTPTIHC
ncbi:hypothetical protein [Nostoc favosum]|uniref:Transposase n=1 Tax=Nostoc favosum CHAB5714 TaxID=2780399 RepID=A0ABS8IKB5_9NOSO|nr:hypothetical protein [Nostoc favosum]MCC5604614.1 hypothetical protein [Nostoc favosum CHAB5714]